MPKKEDTTSSVNIVEMPTMFMFAVLCTIDALCAHDEATWMMNVLEQMSHECDWPM